MTGNLPPDPEGLNAERAQWADTAVAAFQKATGADRSDALPDLLCDIMHLCDRDAELGNFAAQLERASRNYSDETL